MLQQLELAPDTPKSRWRAARMKCWTLVTNFLCTPPKRSLHRSLVAWVMLFAVRLREEGSPLPSLPLEMWIAILELVPRWALGQG